MPSSGSRKPRKALSAAYKRRQKRARELGYKSYYDYRIHDHGRIPADRPPPPKGRRAELRGHGSGTRGFLRSLGEGDLIMLADLISTIGTYIDFEGIERFHDYQKIVVHDRPGGAVTRSYWFRRQTRQELRALIEEETRRGATFSLAPSLDQRRLLRVDER